MVNRKTKGWVIIQEYKYNGIRNNPLGYIYSDGSYSGYVQYTLYLPKRRTKEIGGSGWMIKQDCQGIPPTIVGILLKIL